MENWNKILFPILPLFNFSKIPVFQGLNLNAL